MNHRLIRAALAAGLSVGFATAAFAHAFLDHADPAVGSTVKAAPTQVRIWFSEALEPAFSTIAVSDAKGHTVATGKTSVDAGDKKLLAIGLSALMPGSYRVTWRAVSVDTHVTHGDFTFTVAP